MASGVLWLFAPALLLAIAVSRVSSARRVVSYLAGLVVSVWGTWGLTDALEWLAFTWPAGIFLALMLALEVRAWAMQRPGSLARAPARIALATLVAGLMGYWWFCRSLFLVVGQSYLTGLLPAIPLAAWTVGLAQRRDPGLRSVGLGLLAFSVYFWTSAAVLWWRTR